MRIKNEINLKKKDFVFILDVSFARIATAFSPLGPKGAIWALDPWALVHIVHAIITESVLEFV